MDDIFSLAKGLYDLEVSRLEMVKGQVKSLLSSDIRDVNLIEHLLDTILDLYLFFGTKEVEDLFGLVCEYLKEIDKQAAIDYMDILNEDKKSNEKDM